MQIKKLGFTLAEVLIVIGVIGVIVAITIPIILNAAAESQKKEQFKKIYSTVNNAITAVKADFGYVPLCRYAIDSTVTNNGTECPLVFNKFKEILKYSKVCYGNAYSAGCIPYYEDYGSASCPYFSQNNIQTTDTAFVLDDGAILITYGPNLNGAFVAVDINGQRLPNKWGYDLFTFRFWGNNNVIKVAPGTCFVPEAGGMTTLDMWNYSFK